MPLWRPLIERLIDVVSKASDRIDLIEYSKSCLREGQLPRAASVLRSADETHRIDQELREVFNGDRLFTRRPKDDPKKIEMQERLDSLTSLPWAGYITTNYDTLIIEHLAKVGRPCGNVCSTPYDNLARTLKSSDRPFFIHLHGNVASGPLILSEDDYDDAYLASPPLQSFLRAILLRYTVVFLGTLVEDRFVEMRRQLQLLFKDRRHVPNSPLMSPEYVLLADTDKQRGSYLESTGGFRAIYYKNTTGKHEGLVPALVELRAALTKYGGTTRIPDTVNKRLLAIISKYPEGIDQLKIVQEFWANGPLAAYPDLTSSELYFRLFYLIHKNLISYDDPYQTFKPTNSTARQKKRKK